MGKKLYNRGNYAHELALLYRFIDEGFGELSVDLGPVDEHEMFMYVMKKGRGRFNPAMVKMALERLED